MLIYNARIFTMESGVIENGWLETNGGVISGLGAMETMPPADGERFDAQGGALLPGLIDAHTHLGMWEDSLGFEGDDGNEDTEPSTPQLRAVDAVNPQDRCFDDALAAGVTAILTGPGSANPVGGRMAVLRTFGRRVDDMLLKPDAAMKFALGENPKTVYHGKNQMPVTRMATAAIIREQLFKAKKYGEKLEKAREDEDADEPEFDLHSEALLPVLSRKMQAHFHAHRADDIFTAIRISKEFNLDYVIIHATEGHLIAPELKAEGAPVLSGPFLCDRSKPELRCQTPESPGIMARVGLCPCIITDHPVIPIQYLTLCAGLAVRYGMEYDEALRAVTLYPARVLGLDDRIGSLRAGKEADLAVFDGDPFALSTHVRLVAVGGRRVK
ncbi:MAG: amidohydrolase [Clostridia bacterium]|nr:amidohydrolase [Clostridia bacterium]